MKNNLKQIMQEKKILVEDFAKIMDVTQTTIVNWRNSEKLKPKTQRKIAKALKVDVTELFEC